jgi:prepilin-type N-terminal cleavage/methylation domain-containing protein
MNRLKQGFTIVEVLVVIAVLAILMGIVTTAASSAIKQARDRRASAMKVTLQAGLATYYARENKWPNAIESFADNRPSDKTSVEITGVNADNAFKQLVKESMKNKGEPYIDPSSLFVANASRVPNNPKGANGKLREVYGADFREAIKKNSKRHIEIDNMAFGYPDKETGYFLRYKIIYNSQTDSVTVSQ